MCNNNKHSISTVSNKYRRRDPDYPHFSSMPPNTIHHLKKRLESSKTLTAKLTGNEVYQISSSSKDGITYKVCHGITNHYYRN